MEWHNQPFELAKSGGSCGPAAGQTVLFDGGLSPAFSGVMHECRTYFDQLPF
jgi:hypothetical protein